MRVIDLTGQVFGDLQVIERAGKNISGYAAWICKCKCGNIAKFSSAHLTRKITPVKSCGCRRFRRGKENPLFKGCEEISGSWWRQHVERPPQKKRKTIKVRMTKEEAWNLFVMQNRKCALSNLPISIDRDSAFNTASLDRIDSDGDYSIDNVQWVHKDINFMKRTFSQSYFVGLCDLISKHNATGVCLI